MIPSMSSLSTFRENARPHRRTVGRVITLPRGAPAAHIRREIVRSGVSSKSVREFANPELAYECALAETHDADRIVVFGSVATVEDVFVRSSEPTSVEARFTRPLLAQGGSR
jgi:folylpolyglutamate synthase/dihydropteroate synthase